MSHECFDKYIASRAQQVRARAGLSHARQDREVAKRLCAEHMNTVELYHELLEKVSAASHLRNHRTDV
eukprot:scaffold515733_cov19-Prasinocladus_malaysianus.AAC.1